MTNKLFSLTPSSTPAQIQSGRIYHLGEWCLRTRIGAFLFSFATSEVKRIDTTKRLYLPLVGALLFGAVGALIPTLPFVVATYRFGGYAEFMQVVVFIGFFPFFYLASLVVIIGVMYGAKQRYLGAILVNIVESKFFCRMCVAEMLLAALKRIYGKLGKLTFEEELEGLCYPVMRYQEAAGLKNDRGRWLRGAVAQQVELLSNRNFYENLPELDSSADDYEKRKKAEYHMKRRLFEKLSNSGRRLFRTQDDVYFESHSL